MITPLLYYYYSIIFKDTITKDSNTNNFVLTRISLWDRFFKVELPDHHVYALKKEKKIDITHCFFQDLLLYNIHFFCR